MLSIVFTSVVFELMFCESMEETIVVVGFDNEGVASVLEIGSLFDFKVVVVINFDVVLKRSVDIDCVLKVVRALVELVDMVVVLVDVVVVVVAGVVGRMVDMTALVT